MSENKCQFGRGDLVWVLPFEKVAGKGAGDYFGIYKSVWESAVRRNPHVVKRISSEGNVIFDDIGLCWPPKALLYDDPTCNATAIEDLL